jgi:hypothetical protein
LILTLTFRPHGLRRATVVIAAFIIGSISLDTQAHAQGSFPEVGAATGGLNGGFEMPSTARLASGRFVVALYLHGKPLLSSGTYFQIYTPLGQPAGGFTRVKPMLALDDVFPKVVGAGSGFVVVYNWRQFIDGPQQIMAQRYSGAGVKVGPEFQVNATSPGHILNTRSPSLPTAVSS